MNAGLEPSPDRRQLNFDQVWRMYEVSENLGSVGILYRIPPRERGWLLRHQDEASVGDEGEIAVRTTLDAVLHAASIFEVGFEAGALADQERRVNRHLAPLLELPEVVTYYSEKYPLALPARLLLRSARKALAEPVTNRAIWYSGLLALDGRFRDNELEVFLNLVDGFEYGDIAFDDLQRASRSAERILRAIHTSREGRDTLDRALAGLEKFVLFSSDLAIHLSAIADDHVLQDSAFQLYHYWYSTRHGALARVTRDAIAALSDEGEQVVVSRHLRSTESLFRLARVSTPLGATSTKRGVGIASSRDSGIGDCRNFGVIANIDAWETTTTNRILYNTRKSHKVDEVDDDAATIDRIEQNQSSGFMTMAAATTALWQDKRLNIIHTPGPVDFTNEVERNMRVLDGAVALLDGGQGMDLRTEMAWRQADRYNVPRIVFIDNIDRLRGDFHMCLRTIRERLGVNAVPIQLPIGSERNFKGIVDLVRMKAVVWDSEGLGANYHDEEIPADMKDACEEARNYMIENAVGLDDDAMEAHLSGEEPSVDVLKRSLRKAVMTGVFFPVLAGSAINDIGVQPLLDAVVDYLPSPLDIQPVVGVDFHTKEPVTRQTTDDEPLSVLAFKTIDYPFADPLTFCRIYSGKLQSGMELLNSTRDRREKVGRMLLMHSNSSENIQEARAGDIVALAGLKNTRAGDTLCDPNNSPVILEKMNFPEPVIEIAIQPRSKADQEKLGLALARMVAVDPAFKVSNDYKSGQTIVKGMGELHLAIKLDTLKRSYQVEANIGAPQVAYRESLGKPTDIDYTHKKQTGGTGQFARVKIKFEPGEPGTGFVFENTTVGGSVPKEYVPGVQKGIESAKENGLLAGFPVIDFKATLYDGNYHDVDSSVLAFEIAARAAFRELRERGSPKLLEPIMKVEVLTPEAFIDEITHDITAKRRGQIEGTESRGNAQVVTAFVPLANMFGYINNLQSFSQGRASFTMQCDHYNSVPMFVADNVIDKRA